jgi:hypothetical protein
VIIRRVLIVGLILMNICVWSTAYAAQKVDLVALTYKILSSTTTVTTTAGKVPATAMNGRRTIALFNVDNATTTVYIGHSGVTDSNGFPLDSTCPAIALDLDESVDVYAIVASGTADLRALEVK